MLRPHHLALAILLLAPTAAAASSVKVMGGFFDPPTLDVLVGEEVTWTNEDSMPHTVTSSWDQGASFDTILRAGESFTWKFESEGSFGVHCRPHSGMEMAVTVKALEPGAGIAAPLHETPGAFAFVAIVGLLGASMLLRRR